MFITHVFFIFRFLLLICSISSLVERLFFSRNKQQFVDGRRKGNIPSHGWVDIFFILFLSQTAAGILLSHIEVVISMWVYCLFLC